MGSGFKFVLNIFNIIYIKFISYLQVPNWFAALLPHVVVVLVIVIVFSWYHNVLCVVVLLVVRSKSQASNHTTKPSKARTLNAPKERHQPRVSSFCSCCCLLLLHILLLLTCSKTFSGLLSRLSSSWWDELEARLNSMRGVEGVVNVAVPR